MKSFTHDQLPVTLAGDGVDLRTQPVDGGLTLGWVRVSKGVDLTDALAGLPEGRCQVPHWGYLMSGRLAMHTAGDDQEFAAGEAFYWGPGHVPAALEDCEYIDFSPTHEFDEVLAHLTGGGAR